MRSLQGRVVVVTGVTSGIGRATARRLGRAGARVVGCARDEVRLGAVQKEQPGIDVRRCDVRSAADRAELIATTLSRHGRIDVLVNNAGVGFEGLVEDMTLADVERLYTTNVIGLVDLTRLTLPGMLARHDGDIVMMSSSAAWVSFPPLTAYASTKYAVDGFVEGLRREVWRRGVRVHSVNPGPVSTEWLARSLGHQPGERERGTRPSPGVSPERVVDAVERCLARPWPRTEAVPRVFGAARALAVQPLRSAVDLSIGLTAPWLAATGRRIAQAHTPTGPAGS